MPNGNGTKLPKDLEPIARRLRRLKPLQFAKLAAVFGLPPKPIAQPKPIKSWGVLPKEGIIVITGEVGEGKSATAWWLAEKLHNQGRRIACYAFTRQAKQALPKWIVKTANTVRDVARLKPCVVIVDETAINANARRAMSEGNVDWTKLAAIVRHKGHLLIYIAQHARQVDPALITGANLVVMKRPSQLHLRFSRPELRPELERAFEAFDKIRGDKARKKKAYVVDYRWAKEGMLATGLPTFWSDPLSRAFAAVDFDDMNGPQPSTRGTGYRPRRRNQ